MTTSLTTVAHSAAVNTMIRHLAVSDITFRSDKFLNEHFGRESVAFVAEIGGYELPVRFQAVVAAKEHIWHQFTISEITGERLVDQRYALDARMSHGKLSAGLFGQWLVTSPEVTDPDVVRFFQRIVEKAREAKQRDFTLEAI